MRDIPWSVLPELPASLESLSLEETADNPEESFTLPVMPQSLKSLKVKRFVSVGPPPSDFQLPSQLQQLILNVADGIDSNWIGPISKLKQLTVLKLPSTPINDEELCQLCCLTNLVKLSIPESNNLTAVPLAPLTNLQYLSIARSPVLSSLVGIAQLPKLQYLNLSRCRGLSVHQRRHLSNLTSLTYLDMTDFVDIQESTLLQHLTCLSNLKYLFVNDMFDSISDSWAQLKEALPQLETHPLSATRYSVM